MNEHPYEIGRVTISKQGHDRGRAFVIVGVADEKHVLIADGDTRKLAQPKKKQCKHLRTKPFVAEAVVSALARGDQSADSEIRKALASLAAELGKDPLAKAGSNAVKEECALVQE